MRRVVATVVLVVVGFGAVWCVDGCVDPVMQQDAPAHSEGSTCIVCVVPFTMSPFVVGPMEVAVVRVGIDRPVAHLWAAPTFSIEHPPRFF